MGHDFFQIFPHIALGGRIPQEIGGMIGGEKRHAAKFEPLAAETRNGLLCAEQGLERDGAKANNDLRMDDVELAKKERRAGFDFVGLGRAIFRRTAFDNVADVDILAAETHGFDHLREQFSGAADERQALDIFIVARAFADENEFRRGAARAEYDVGALLAELAAFAVADVGANAFESVAGDALGGFEQGDRLDHG